MVTVDWCCTCKKNGETTDHLFLHYPSSPRVVEYGVITIWGLLGHATWCCGSLSKLVRQVEQTQKVLWSMILS